MMFIAKLLICCKQ